MLSFYLVWTLIYFLLLSELAKSWPERTSKITSSLTFPKVSLLIPCRNESENIYRLSEEFKKIHFPDLEVILVDDQSEDGTFELIQSAGIRDQRIVALKSPGIGKKSALEYGISQAKGEIILCSDADCSFPKNWVEGMVARFENQPIQLVAGPVMVKGSNLLGHFQQTDWASILLLTSYFFSKKKPLMCSAANLAYRKSAFLEVMGYEGNRDFASGDDEFLLKKISQTFGAKSCIYLPFAENLVLTKSESNWKALINQRVRWAGKWKAHRSIAHAGSAIFSVVVQLIWLGSFGLLALGFSGYVVFGLVWSFKNFIETRYLGKVLRNIGIDHPSVNFIAISFVHPIYVLGVSLGAILGNFTWKGRRTGRSA